MTSTCRTPGSAAAGCPSRSPVALGTRLDQVAAALSTYEARNGKGCDRSQLLGSGVDLGAQDTPRVSDAAR